MDGITASKRMHKTARKAGLMAKEIAKQIPAVQPIELDCADEALGLWPRLWAWRVWTRHSWSSGLGRECNWTCPVGFQLRSSNAVANQHGTGSEPGLNRLVKVQADVLALF